LIIVGGVHGNEPAGVLGLKRLFEQITTLRLTLPRGRLVGLTGNRKALAVGKRFLAQDLNRHWQPGRVEHLRHTQQSLDAEDEELRQLDTAISSLVQEAWDGFPVYLLDIHTTSGEGGAFVNLEDALPNRAFAFAFPVPVILGLEEELSGTLTAFWGDQGLVTAGFEAGQHEDPEATERATAAAWIALEAAGLLDSGHSEVADARQRLTEEHCHLPHVLELRYRHCISPEDWFRMDPGYINFQTVRQGQTLAVDRGGPVCAPVGGLILMPLYQKLGADGFFITRPVHPLWLELSAVLRRLHLERFLHWLPGVQRHPQWTGSFIADRRFARFLVPELFHLLGFRREGEAKGRYLVMSRRPHDRTVEGSRQDGLETPE
jgi:succinylglutamate desuccinylase